MYHKKHGQHTGRICKILNKGTCVITGILYPARCVMCNEVIGGGRTVCCQTCREKLPFIREPRCYKCGKALEDMTQEYCLDCTKKKHFYTRGIALWGYNEQVKHAVYRYKYKNQRVYAGYFADELVQNCGAVIRSWEADMLVPVPLHRARYRKRGFNQAQLLAEKMSQQLGLSVCPHAVGRVRNTRPQKELNDKERQKNLKSAFIIDENSVKLKKIILVDDIYTTGATVDAITELLLCAGALQVYVVTLCIGRGY